jgi:threonyl-tRNA synthetase
VPGTRLVGNGWDLTRIAGAYWRGSEKNPQLQRIYGTAWPTKGDVVVDRELAGADLRRRALGGVRAGTRAAGEVDEDLKAIKKEMERIVRENQRFVRRVVTEDEARAEMAGSRQAVSPSRVTLS